MGSKKWVEDHFSKRLRAERERRGWSQSELAQRLADGGIDWHWTTVAKVEKSTRSVRIDEASAIADLFGVSLDALMGRRARPKADLRYRIEAVLGTAQQAAWTASSLENTLRDQTDDLASATGDGLAEFIEDAEAACAALALTGKALGRVGTRPDHGVVDQATKAVLRAYLEEDDDA